MLLRRIGTPPPPRNSYKPINTPRGQNVHFVILKQVIIYVVLKACYGQLRRTGSGNQKEHGALEQVAE
jgi:hypothetical protein